MHVLCVQNHVSLSVFVSVFCDSFSECDVCLCDVGSPPSPPQLIEIHTLLFFFYLCFHHSHRKLPFANHPAGSDDHHHQLPRHPALAPRRRREVFNDQRASAGPATQRLAHAAQRQAEPRPSRVCEQAVHSELLQNTSSGRGQRILRDLQLPGWETDDPQHRWVVHFRFHDGVEALKKLIKCNQMYHFV